MKELILVKVRFGAAKKVPNLRSKLNACLVLKKVLRLLEDGDDERGLGLVGEGFAIFIVQFDEYMGELP